MIFYYDTSALLKLFIDEQYSEQIQAMASQATLNVVSELTWIEMCAALGRRTRTGETSKINAEIALEQIAQNWPSYRQIQTSPNIIQSAGNHAQTFGLRAYDSVQLACAQSANIALSGQMTFCCFDKALNNAARVLGMKVLEL
jgi:predicted nucleic acid-binding protein